MKNIYLTISLFLLAVTGETSAEAARFTATSANLKAVFAAAAAGDTIALTGDFGQLGLSNRSFATPLIIDASRAQFNGTLAVSNITGLSFIGGTFGASTTSWQTAGTIRVSGSSSISFTSLTLIGDGLGKARGISFRDSNAISLTDSSFTGFRLAGGASSVTNGLFSGNRITASTSDGINIVDSHFITASGNICSGGIPSAGAHPDCIQLWSLAGNPVQSDIRILNNKAYGNTQGFTSFDPHSRSGLRIEMSGNYINTSFPQGIACYGCVDSRFTDNILITAPGARFRTNMNIIGGTNNFLSGNSIGPGPTHNAQALALFAAAPAVPEPAIWAQLLLGFGLTGGLLRRRQLLRVPSR